MPLGSNRPEPQQPQRVLSYQRPAASPVFPTQSRYAERLRPKMGLWMWLAISGGGAAIVCYLAMCLIFPLADLFGWSAWVTVAAFVLVGMFAGALTYFTVNGRPTTLSDPGSEETELGDGTYNEHRHDGTSLGGMVPPGGI